MFFFSFRFLSFSRRLIGVWCRLTGRLWIRFGKSIWHGSSDSARGSIIKTLRSFPWFTSSYSVLLSRPSLHQPCHFQSCSNCSRIFHFPPLSVVSASRSAQTQGLVLVFRSTSIKPISIPSYIKVDTYYSNHPSFQAIHLSIHLVKL